MKKFYFDVEGIKCGGCSSKISNGIGEMDQVSNVEVSVENKSVKVEGADQLSGMTLKAKLEELGFSVTNMKKES